MRFLFISFIILISFNGCSSKQPDLQTEESAIELEIDQEDNQTASEFDDEFDEEVETTYNPFDGYNEIMTSFNDDMIIYGIDPLANLYSTVIPEAVRLGISNALHNLQFPIRFANNLLQGKFENLNDETGRFLINSTLGIAGLMDPAKEYKGMLPHNEDFGQTLGHYGIGSGYHIVLPFIGPSNVRDIVGISIDAYASPLVNIRALENYKIPKNTLESAAIYGVHVINKVSLEPGQYKSIKKDAIELYPFLRDIYEQKRLSEIAE